MFGLVIPFNMVPFIQEIQDPICENSLHHPIQVWFQSALSPGN